MITNMMLSHKSLGVLLILMLTFQSVALFNFKIGSSKKKPVVLDEKESNKDENT